MSDDNVDLETNDQDQLQEPPFPEEIEVEQKEQPEMSEAATLANIFFEPGRTFADLRKKPRFIIGFIIIAILSSAFFFAFSYKMGEDRMRRAITEQAEKNSQFASLSDEAKKQNIDLQMTIQKVVRYALPIFIVIGFLIGTLIYWLGAKVMGGTINFMQALSVWVYSSLPPTIVSTVANFLILFLKSPDDIDILASQRGLVNANPSLFFGGREMPVLTTLISTIDIFAIWGLVLAAIGLHKVARLSKGSAWAIVLILALFGIMVRVVSAYFNGIPS